MLLLFLILRPAASEKVLENGAWSEEEERGGGECSGAGRTEGMSGAGGVTCTEGIAAIEPGPEPIPVLLVCLRAKTRVGWIALVVTVCAECRLRAVGGRTGTGTEGMLGTDGTVGTVGGMVGVLVAARMVDANGELSSAALREDADADCCTTGMEDDGAIFVFVLILFVLGAGGGGGISENCMGRSCSESHLKDVRGSGRMGDGCARRWF